MCWEIMMKCVLGSDKVQKTMMKKINRSLQGKLALWYLSSVTIIIVIFLVTTGGLFWFTLQNQIDHHVHIVVTEAAQIVQRFQGEQRHSLLTNLVSAKGMTIVLLSPDGAPILETNSPDVALVTEHQLQGILSSSSLYGSTPSHFTESGIRFAALPVEVNAGKGILAVGYSTGILYSTFTNMLLIVGAIILFCVIPVTYLGFHHLKKNLKPLRSIANQAKKINTTKSLSRRIHLDQPTEELATIQATLNEMLSQLERVFISEQTFFSDSAHTLKTPLAVLRSGIENLTLGAKEKSKLLSIIDSTNETIGDLLFLSKVGNSNRKKETFSLSRLLTDLVEITTTLGESKKITVSSEIEGGVKIKSNRQLLLRALSNVAHNAVIYNKDGGSIVIKMKTSGGIGGKNEKDGKIKITISDTGQGVAKKDLKKIFERFYRAGTGGGRSSSGSQSGADSRSVHSGSGLGLAITKAVITNLGGALSFDSKKGVGSTLTITLPAS